MTDRRLVEKTVMLGLLRELEPPQDHIGAQFLPLQGVQSDDVIWDSVKGLVQDLAPARAMDAESALAQRDEIVGTGKASIIDWSLKHRWNPSDVARYRELTTFAGSTSIPRTVSSITDDFAAKMARAALKRRRALDNRLEWLRWQAIRDSLSYNDTKIIFAATYGIPSDQKAVVPSTLWSNTAADPIGDVIAIRETVRNRTGVELRRAVTSRKVLFNVMNNSKFAQMFSGQNPFYMLQSNWGIEAASEKLAQVTDMQWQVFDSVYRTRPFGGTTITSTRFTDERDVYLFPGAGDIINYSGSNNGLGLGELLSSPHPEGNWEPGFYEWEKNRTDPWGVDQGSGIKAFPVIYSPEVLASLRVLA